MLLTRFALRFPYTIYVLALLIAALGTIAVLSSPRDVFPAIDEPVVTVIWEYDGLAPDEMEHRITNYSEYAISDNVNGVARLESQTLQGLAVEKVHFQPGTNIDLAISQVVSASNSIRSFMPPGVQPPYVFRSNAAAVPVLQISLSSDTLNEQQLYDYGLYRIREALVTIPGITLPTPYGGKFRQLMVDLDPDALRATGMTPDQVAAAVNAEALTVPSGRAKMGSTQFIVRVDTSLPNAAAFERIPLKSVGGRVLHLGDVAHVRDGWAVQSNIVRSNGERSVLLPVIKNGNASTTTVVNAVKAALPAIRAAAPPGMKIDLAFDQSTLVAKAVGSVVEEGLTAAALTAAAILLFLGSGRPTLVVAVSIPLSVLAALGVLHLAGHSLNTMTLGGLALAVGILVDDATVTIENTYRLIEEGRGVDDAVLEGAAGIALPTLASTLAICAAFAAVLFLRATQHDLFAPLALAILLAMLTSYLLSRTLVPILLRHLLRGSRAQAATWHAPIERAFDRARAVHAAILSSLLRAPRRASAAAAIAAAAAFFLLPPLVGRDYYPEVDGGVLQLHVRAAPGTRIESTAALFQGIEDEIRDELGAEHVGYMLDNIGLPQLAYNLAFTDGTTTGPNDGEILFALAGGLPTHDALATLRRTLPARFPQATLYFQAADTTTQILDQGTASQIDLQVGGYDMVHNLAAAQRLVAEMRKIPGLVDVHLQEEIGAPELLYTVDRDRARQFGVSVETVADNLDTSLSSSWQLKPNFWTDPALGIPYNLAVQVPEFQLDSVRAIDDLPVSARVDDAGDNAHVTPVTLGNLARARRVGVQSVFRQTNIAPVYDVFASVAGTDLGHVAASLAPLAARTQGTLAPGSTVTLRGQIEDMGAAFDRLGLGLIAAVAAVYLLLVMNFQSFRQPLAVMLALPGAGIGILLTLFATGTTLSVPSAMGAIMAVGISSANAILLVHEAIGLWRGGAGSAEAAFAASRLRFRPVVMTASAMLVGMIPMALGGAGAEQNAALARAVIGGLLGGTATTLFFVPALFSMLNGRNAALPTRS